MSPRTYLSRKNATGRASAVGAHHQNGVAERNIQTIMSWALSMMLHQLLHWPDAFDEALWPFALEHAVYLWNHLPKSRSGLSPHELFAGSISPNRDEVLRARVWGSPVWVLDPALQDGRYLPRWSKRSALGMHLGVSPCTVHNVLKYLAHSFCVDVHLDHDVKVQY